MKFKYIVSFCGISFLCFHFILSLIYCFPQHFNSVPRIGLINYYMFPIFNQNWKLFAPDPPVYNKNLYYRVKTTDSTWSDWKDPGKELLQQHYSNRFSYYGKLYTVYENLGKELYYTRLDLEKELKPDSLRSEQKKQEEINGKLIKTAIYALAKRYFTAASKNDFPGKNIKEIEFMYVFNYVVDYKKKNDPTAKNEYQFNRYPSFSLEK